MKNQITKSEIEQLSYPQLRKLCPQFNVVFKNQSKEKLISLLIQNSGPSNNSTLVPDKKEVTKTTSTKPSSKIKNIEKKKPSGKSKSDKIRAMLEKGIRVAKIATTLNAHPSFIYTVKKSTNLSAKK